MHVRKLELTQNQIAAFIGHRHQCAGAIDKCTDREPLFASATRTILRRIRLFLSMFLYTPWSRPGPTNRSQSENFLLDFTIPGSALEIPPATFSIVQCMNYRALCLTSSIPTHS